MDADSVARARRYVEHAEIPQTRAGYDEAVDVAGTSFDAAKNQATVVGSDVIAFVRGVAAERRDAIVNSSLLAQLVAKKKVGDPGRLYDWYDAYFEVLTNVGWVLQDRSFAEYHERADNFEAHKAVLEVATMLLAGAPAALQLVTTTLKALHSMDQSRPWITIFNRESQTARTARFQISLVEQDADGQFLVSLMAFGLEAKAAITQVLFFRARTSEATLRHYSGKVTINTTVLDGIRDSMKAKLLGHARNYVSALPDL